MQRRSGEDLHDHLDDFGVDHGRVRADGFGADLEELAVAALLRAFAAEHRADVVELLEAGLLVEPVLDVGADHRGGVFGTQGEGTAVAVLEGVHLLADDVGLFADAAREQLGLLEDRRADLCDNKGHEVAYNRWYERDHFYAGCMIGAWNISGPRFVATRDLKALRYPADSPVIPDPTTGSYLALYWVLAGKFGQWMQWGSEQVKWLHENDRMFEERDHVHTLMYKFRTEFEAARRRAGRAGARPPLALRRGGDRRAGRGHVARRRRRLVPRAARSPAWSAPSSPPSRCRPTPPRASRPTRPRTASASSGSSTTTCPPPGTTPSPPLGADFAAAGLGELVLVGPVPRHRPRHRHLHRRALVAAPTARPPTVF